MYKKLLALSLALFLCVCPVFAVSDADNSYYSFEPVAYGSLGGRSLSTLAASSGWSDTDHDYLNQIRLALTSKNTGTLLSYIISIKDSVSNSYDKLFYIKQNTDYLPNISNNTNDAKSLLSDAKSFLNQIELNTRKLPWTKEQATSVTSDVHRLQETLASDDDKALADAQKPSRKEIEKLFASGSTDRTSLGASDFVDLSNVGGSVRDSLSLNWQSNIHGFTGGLSDSDTAGQGWFSAETRDALDSVSSSSTYGLKREKGNSDIYNMAGFAENYSWLYGE